MSEHIQTDDKSNKGLEAHQIFIQLESVLSQKQWTFFCGYLLGMLSEINYLLNDIFWTFFDRGKRRYEFLQALSKGGQTNRSVGFWLDNNKMKKKHLDCLGKKTFLQGLDRYFAEYPKKTEYFNDCLRMRFLIFYESPDDFFAAVQHLHKLRNYVAHPEETKNRLSDMEAKQALNVLCYLVHPVFFGLLKGKIRSLAKGCDFEASVNEAFAKLQNDRKARVKRERRDFFSKENTRKEKGRSVTRQWQQFKERWEKKKEDWDSSYKLQNFIYQYQRINPESLKKYAQRCAPQCDVSFKEIEAIYILLSELDLLLWEYLPQVSTNESQKKIKDIRNCLAHNEKVGVHDTRCLKSEFGVLLNYLDAITANDFYTQADAILRRRNHRIDRATGAKVRYQEGKEYCKETLENPKLRRRVSASIKRDLKAAKCLRNST